MRLEKGDTVIKDELRATMKGTVQRVLDHTSGRLVVVRWDSGSTGRHLESFLRKGER